LDADPELYTDTKCGYISEPLATDDLKHIFWNGFATDITITKMNGESDQNVVWNFQVDDGAPSDVSNADLNCNIGECNDAALDGDTNLAVGESLDLKITSVANVPQWFAYCLTYTVND